jgi:hypothetical protein
MAKRLETSLMEPLGESEFGELDDLLLSDDLPEACMDVIILEGIACSDRHWAGDSDA